MHLIDLLSSRHHGTFIAHRTRDKDCVTVICMHVLASAVTCLQHGLSGGRVWGGLLAMMACRIRLCVGTLFVAFSLRWHASDHAHNCALKPAVYVLDCLLCCRV